MTSRRQFLSGTAVTALAGFIHAPRAAAPDSSRVAMVVGNDTYKAAPLANAVNDANAVAELLVRAGFGVTLRTNAAADGFTRAVREFGAAIERPETKLAIFYYAGHGVQVDWRNYLLPVDANFTSAEELKRQCVDLGLLLEAMSRARERTFVIVLDACRDNPFGDGWRPERKGLSQFDAPVGSLIAYSTAPGSVASDGPGKNGLYTQSLVKELAVRGARFEDALKRVRLSVRLASGGAQVPWESTSLESDVFLFPPEVPLTDEEDERRFEAEHAHWKRIYRSTNPADWVGFLREFPAGRMSEMAQSSLDKLLESAEAGRPERRPRPNAARIRLGKGAPVPAFLGRSQNPYSAGSYPLDRHFSVGDTAAYRQIDGETGAFVKSLLFRVTRVDPAAGRVELNGGLRVIDLLGNNIKIGRKEWDPPAQASPAELQVGKRWTARFRVTTDERGKDLETEFEIVRREIVRVPAGEFDAFRIEGRTRRQFRREGFGRPQRQARGAETTIWEVPGLNFPVKRERVAHGLQGDRGLDHEILELVSLSQAGGEGS